MNKTTGIIVGIVVLIVALGGAYALMDKGGDSMMEKNTEESLLVEGENMMVGDDTMVQGADESMMTGEEGAMVKMGSYEAYSPEKIARAETGDVVLFFHASWCPTCRALSSDIEKNISAIPAEVSILKVDYDKETELKRKYGVTYQHTLVQVDANGTLIKKWSASPTLSHLVSQIN